METETDVDGNYEIRNVPLGTYTVTASKEGYIPKTEPNIDILENEITTVDFVLEEREMPPTNKYIWLESENANYLTPDFEIISDPSASNGKYIQILEGVGYRANDGEAMYNIQIDIPGNYIIWGNIIAPTETNNSFFVQFDNNFEVLWTTPLSNNWKWSKVNHWGSGEEFDPEIDSVIFNLSEGNHILKIKQREDGIKLDKLLITNDLSYIPETPSEEPIEPPEEKPIDMFLLLIIVVCIIIIGLGLMHNK